MRGIALGLLALLFAPLALSQQTAAGRLGQSIGQLIFHDRAADERAYEAGARQALIDNALMEEARRNNAEAALLEQTRQIQAALQDRFVHAGIAEDEASAMAMAYRSTPDESAIIARARREGSAKTLDSIKQAYAAYNYLLVDQLTIGYFMALHDEAEAQKATSP